MSASHTVTRVLSKQVFFPIDTHTYGPPKQVSVSIRLREEREGHTVSLVTSCEPCALLTTERGGDTRGPPNQVSVSILLEAASPNVTVCPSLSPLLTSRCLRVSVCVIERECVCVSECVCERERDRARESDCECVRLCVCVCVSLSSRSVFSSNGFPSPRSASTCSVPAQYRV